MFDCFSSCICASSASFWQLATFLDLWNSQLIYCYTLSWIMVTRNDYFHKLQAFNNFFLAAAVYFIRGKFLRWSTARDREGSKILNLRKFLWRGLAFCQEVGHGYLKALPGFLQCKPDSYLVSQTPFGVFNIVSYEKCWKPSLCQCSVVVRWR